ncbi:nucleotidyl transferase AbiEii/AbiGii toxin family protein [Bradyrhizobium jicamae]|uniref:Nucleotidyl transferase AbiEii/AbiGii toxin family protein n=1 Tax=Bradyrhizobium jicamae TaxID=280332 RepID=A0ABS5FDI4_9BRAD|nr:nucleotidyl transferase AbiEii/AbiGii toxin family protein [Bradyrhizobium jicamae]MBR0794855.1 nucleotidyl transferase AbiEii/AbiGii toxin family protein [Bradyrhizobium jicamae]
MPRDYLHNHPEFADLIRIVAEEKSIDPALVEKDYWIMHCLRGLQQLDHTFQLKGGTSLSKGHRIINRFSEDIDILIEPPAERHVKTGKNQNSSAQIKTRKDFYEWLAQSITIDGIASVERDTAFDDVPNYRGAGIRLNYDGVTGAMEGLREGVLLEVGFDTVAPNEPRDVSSWIYDYAAGKVDIIDNQAKAVPCYDLGYTFVEKLQTVSTKFRNQQADGSDPVEFMRHYYDIHELLQQPAVQKFMGTNAYKEHKKARFRQADNQNIAENGAFILSDAKTRALYADAYMRSSALYYAGKPTFEEIMAEIHAWAGKL